MRLGQPCSFGLNLAAESKNELRFRVNADRLTAPIFQ
jgi:hypothetical protein